MEVPILIQGEKAGVLQEKKEGLYIVFEARLPATGDLTRLWVAGAGQSGYLGLMEPKGAEQILRRRLTAAERRKLPSPIEFASTVEPVWEPASPDQGAAGSAASAGDAPAREPARAEGSEGQGESGSQPRPVATGPPAAGAAPPAPDRPPPAAETLPPSVHETGAQAAGEGLLWFSRPDGSLVAFDGRCRWLALPARLRQAPTGLRLLRIGGREYLVFRT